jgi:HAD superfamily hydrolase (TIGR01509 family)
MPRDIPTRIRAVLYDFDGTVIDSAESSFQCYVHTFAKFEIPFDYDTFQRTYSPNWLYTYKAVGLPADRWNEANELWLQLYSSLQCRLIDGVAAAMRQISQHGIRQGLVTSGSRTRVLRDVTSIGIADLLHAILCNEDVVNKKPHPEALHRAMDQMEIRPQEAVYVGDSPEDVQMARAAGVFSVAIPGKYPNREALQAAGADLYVTCLPELARLIAVSG